MAERGDLLLDAGVRVAGAGDIGLRANDGAIRTTTGAAQWRTEGTGFDPDLDWALVNRRFDIDLATGAITAARLNAADAQIHGLTDGDVLRAAGGAYVQTTFGKLTMIASGAIGEFPAGTSPLYSPLAIFVDAEELVASSSGRENVLVIAADAVDVGDAGARSGDSGARAGLTRVFSLQGAQTVHAAIDAGGDDISLIADDLDIAAPIRSAGGNLNIRPNDPTVALVIGDLVGDGSGKLAANTNIAVSQTLNLGRTDIRNIGAGFGNIVIGAAGSGNPIYFTSNTGSGITLNAPTTLYANGQGGEILIGTNLTAPSLLVFGSGATTTVGGNITLTSGSYTLNDSARISGSRTITAQAGNITFGQSGFPYFVVGDSLSTTDALTLSASGSVNFISTIGGGNEAGTDLLNGLTITQATNVTFNEEVVVNGSLSINATGTVTFNRGVRLTNGGSLSVTGATQINFGLNSSINLEGGGNLLLEGNEIDLNMATNAVVGTGTVTLRTANAANAIELGSFDGAGINNAALNLSMGELRTLGEGFSRIVIGHASAGHAAAAAAASTVTLGANDSGTTPIFRDDVVVYGGSITVADSAFDSWLVRVGAGETLTLDAVNNIEILNEIEADSITLYSALGSIGQADATSDGRSGEALRSLELVATAKTGINLGSIETPLLSVTNTGDGDITLGVNGVRIAAPIGRFTTSQITGDLSVARLTQTLSTGTGDIALTARGGSIGMLSGHVGQASAITLNGTASSGLANLGTGSTALNAQGNGETLLISQSITSRGAITFTTAGSLVTAAGVTLSATGTGSDISLTAMAGSITLGGNLVSGGSGTSGGLVALTAGTGITMVDGTTLTSVGTSGRAGLVAGGDILVSQITVTSSVGLRTTGGAIVDNLAGNGNNLVGEAADAVLYAANGIGAGSAPLRTALGTLVATNTAAGGVFITEATGLTVADTLPPVDAPLGMNLGGIVDASGRVALVLTSGNLSVIGGINSSATGAGSGHILLQTLGGSIDIAANVQSSAGSISVLASASVAIGTSVGGVQLTTLADAATVDVQAAAGTVTMGATAGLVTNNGAQRVQAAGNVVLGQLATGSAGASDNRAVSVLSGGAIIDADADGASAAANVSGSRVRLDAANGVGTATNAIELSIGTVAARSSAGGLFLSEHNGLTVGNVAAVTVNRVGGNGTTTALADSGALTGLSAGANGALVVRSGTGTTGTLSIDAAVSAVGTGNLLLHNSGGALRLNADVDAGSGNASLVSTGELSLAADADLRSTGAATLDLRAASVIMAQGATLSTGSGNVRIAAGGALQLGAVSTSGSVSLAALNISDAFMAGGGGGSGSGTDTVNVTADMLRIVTSGTGVADGAGSAANALELAVNTLAAAVNGGGGLFLSEADALQIGTLAAINVDSVGANGTTLTVTTDAALSHVDVEGALVIVAGGSITTLAVGGAISASGNLLVQASGAASDITLGAALSNDAGATSLNAGRDLHINASVSVSSTGGASGAGQSLDLLAGGAISMAEGTALATANGHIGLQAGSGNITLETLTAGTGSVRVVATAGSIVDQDSDANGATADDITASGALLMAGGAIGSGGNHLELAVATLSANAGAGGLFITERNGLTVDTLAVQVQRVAANAVATVTATAGQDDLKTGAGGALVLVSTGGDLVLADEVTAAGGGAVLLQAAGAVTLHNAVDAGGGALSVVAGGALTQAVAIATTGSASIDLQAGGALTMAQGATLSTGSGNVRIAAGGALQLGAVSTSGSVSLAALNISDAFMAGGGGGSGSGTDTVNVTADMLRIVTSGTGVADGAGSAANALELAVNTLAAAVNGGGGLFLSEADALQIGTLAAINVDSVGANGTTLTVTTDAALSHVDVEGALVIVAGGSITTLAVGGAISASGNLLVQASGAASDITLGAALSNDAGATSLNAGRDLHINASVSVSSTGGASGAGQSLDLLAGGAISMADGTRLSSRDADIALWADTGAVLVGSIDAGNGRVSLRAATSITDGHSGTDDDGRTDVTAAGLVLRAGTGVGNGLSHLETAVDTLSASVGAGGLFISETAGLVVDRQTVSAQRVAANGSVPTGVLGTATVTLQDLTATGAGHIVVEVASGALTLQPGTANTAAVLLDAGHLRLASGDSLGLNGALIATGGGAISLVAGGAMALANAGTVTASGTGDLQLQAGGTLSMGASTMLATGSGQIRVQAGDLLTLGRLSTTGAVALQAAAITDAGSGASDAVNVSAASLRLLATGTAAGQGLGSGSNPLELSVDRLAADVRGTGGVFLREADGLDIGTVAAMSTALVGRDGSLGSLADAALAGLASGGALTLSLAAGSLTSQAGTGSVAAAGAVLLAATASDGALALGASVSSSGGPISLAAGAAINLSGLASVLTAGGSIDLLAGSTLTMADGSLVRSGGGNIRAAAAGDMTIGALDARSAGAQSAWGSVSLVSTAGRVLDSSGDAAGTLDVQGRNLRLQAAAGGVGSASDALETEVAMVAAAVGSAGLSLSDASALTVGTTPALSVQRVAGSGATSVVTDAPLSDITATDGGSVLVNAGSTVTLTDGADGDGLAVSVNGGGTVTVNAGSGNVLVQADVQSSAGTITVVAAQGRIEVDAVLRTGSGDVALSSLGSVQWGGEGRTERTEPGAGGTLTLNSFLPTQDIVIGGTAPANPLPGDTTWYFDLTALAKLADGYGNVVIGGADHTGRITLDGSTSALALRYPVLVQAAAGADIVLRGAVSGVGLQVAGAAPLLLDGARVRMRGSQGILLQGPVQLRGDVVLSADRLQFSGGAGSVQATTAGGATLALRPLDASLPVLLGSGAGSAEGWQLDQTLLAAIGTGLRQVEIGQLGATGAVQVRGQAAVNGNLVVWGQSLQMAAGSTLSSSGDLALLVPGGAVVTRLGAGGELRLQATGSGAVLRSGLAVGQTNITAASLVLEGMGPVAGSGTPLRVDAARVDVLTPSGVVMRQTQANGDVRVVVMADGQLHEQLINVHRSFVTDGRDAATPVPSLQTPAGAAPSGRGDAGYWGNAWGQGSSEAVRKLLSSLAVNSSPVDGVRGVGRLATADVQWHNGGDGGASGSVDLDRAFLLGAPASQPLWAGAVVADTSLAEFDYWVETLTL